MLGPISISFCFNFKKFKIWVSKILNSVFPLGLTNVKLLTNEFFLRRIEIRSKKDEYTDIKIVVQITKMES